MAFTVSTIVNGVMGADRLQILRVTADATTQNIVTGFNVLKIASCMNEGASTCPVISFNSTCTGVAQNGTVGMSNCTSGQIYHLWVVAPA